MTCVEQSFTYEDMPHFRLRVNTEVSDLVNDRTSPVSHSRISNVRNFLLTFQRVSGDSKENYHCIREEDIGVHRRIKNDLILKQWRIPSGKTKS